MASTRWADVRAEMTAKAGGEEAVAEARVDRVLEVRVAVDEPRDDHAPVEPHPHPELGRRPDRGDPAAAEQDVRGLPAQWPRAPDHPGCVRHAATSAPPSSRYRTAIRTLTPFATCSVIVDRAQSATSAAISTPRAGLPEANVPGRGQPAFQALAPAFGASACTAATPPYSRCWCRGGPQAPRPATRPQSLTR